MKYGLKLNQTLIQAINNIKEKLVRDDNIRVTGSVGMGETEANTIKNKIDAFDYDKEIATFYNKNDNIIEIKNFQVLFMITKLIKCSSKHCF